MAEQGHELAAMIGRMIHDMRERLVQFQGALAPTGVDECDFVLVIFFGGVFNEGLHTGGGAFPDLYQVAFCAVEAGG